jgi:hypothetical protein
MSMEPHAHSAGRQPHGEIVRHLGNGRWWDQAQQTWRNGRGRKVPTLPWPRSSRPGQPRWCWRQCISTTTLATAPTRPPACCATSLQYDAILGPPGAGTTRSPRASGTAAWPYPARYQGSGNRWTGSALSRRIQIVLYHSALWPPRIWAVPPGRGGSGVGDGSDHPHQSVAVSTRAAGRASERG